MATLSGAQKDTLAKIAAAGAEGLVLDKSAVRSERARAEEAMKLSEAQRWLLEGVREASDLESPLHKSKDVSVPGLVARGNTIRSLERRGLVVCGGFCQEVDGDGCSIEGRDNEPFYTITDLGRAALQSADKKEDSK